MLRLGLVALVLVSSGELRAQVFSPGPTLGGERLFVSTTDDALTGGVVALHGPPAKVATQTLATTNGGRLLRRFGDDLWMVTPAASAITRIPTSGGSVQVYPLGIASQPQDVHVVAPPVASAARALVTRRDETTLIAIDVATGLVSNVVDLAPVGGGSQIQLGTMERDGHLLFVQVKVLADEQRAAPDQDTGVLAVVDLTTDQLVDVDSSQLGIQGIELLGAPPRFKMQVIERTRQLFVSTTESFLDHRGGIEIVDLDQLESVGFAITEANGHADMGGFVMTSPTRGYYVFHTDLLASTHLQPFTIAGGPDPGPEIIVLLEDTVDFLGHDPFRKRLYLPGGFSSNAPGLYVFDSETSQQLGPPIDTGMRPHDVVLAPYPAAGRSLVPLK